MKTSKKWATVLEGTIVVVLAVFLSVLAGCANPAAGVTTTDAVAAAQTVSGALSAVMANQMTSSGGWLKSGNVSYSTGYGVSMTGTVTLVTEQSGTTTTSTYRLDLTITFSSYSDPATGYTVNGAVTVTATEDAASYAVESGSISTSGALTLSGGSVSSESWNATDFTTTGSSSGTPPVFSSFTGNVTCNGVSFDASSLSLGATSSAALGAEAVVDSISSSAVASALGITLPFGSGGGSAGVTATIESTTTSGSNTIVTLKITYSGYPDSTTGYTLTSGTVTVVMTNDTSTSSTSYSISGGPIVFSGGPGLVTSQTWNNVAMSSSGILLGGAVSSNGIPCDARTL